MSIRAWIRPRLPKVSRRSGYRELQRQAFGVDHQDLGLLLLESWGFPPTLVEAAGHHHDPMTIKGPSRSLATPIAAVETVDPAGPHGLLDELPTEPVDPAVFESLGVTPEQCGDHIPRLLEAATEVEQAFGGDASAAN